MSDVKRVPLWVRVEDLKTLRETLCLAQAAVDYAYKSMPVREESSDRLGELINQIDWYRPLGSDGKHGNKHTEYCGCEDK